MPDLTKPTACSGEIVSAVIGEHFTSGCPQRVNPGMGGADGGLEVDLLRSNLDYWDLFVCNGVGCRDTSVPQQHPGVHAALLSRMDVGFHKAVADIRGSS